MITEYTCLLILILNDILKFKCPIKKVWLSNFNRYCWLFFDGWIDFTIFYCGERTPNFMLIFLFQNSGGVFYYIIVYDEFTLMLNLNFGHLDHIDDVPNYQPIYRDSIQIFKPGCHSSSPDMQLYSTSRKCWPISWTKHGWRRLEL